jgi:hypothetical protein
MLRLRVFARTLVVGTLITLGLGCTGMMTGVMDLAGIEMRMGADAVHPPDFPAMPLTVGEKVLSLKMTAKGDQVNLPDDIPMPPEMPLESHLEYDIEAVIYTVPAEERPIAVAQAVLQVLSAGFVEMDDPPPPEEGIQELHVSTSNKAVFAIVGAQDGSDSSVVLVRLRPAAAAEAPAEAGGGDEAPAKE